jgi:hypothetical protein
MKEERSGQTNCKNNWENFIHVETMKQDSSKLEYRDNESEWDIGLSGVWTILHSELHERMVWCQQVLTTWQDPKKTNSNGMVSWNASEIWEWWLSPSSWPCHGQQDVDLLIWSWNKTPGYDLNLQWWFYFHESEKAIKCWKEDGGLFLFIKYLCGCHYTWNSMYCYSTTVHNNKPDLSDWKASRKLVQNIPVVPKQRFFTYSKHHNHFPAEHACIATHPLNLQSRPGTVRSHF